MGLQTLGSCLFHHWIHTQVCCLHRQETDKNSEWAWLTTLFNDLFEKGCFATGTVKENRVGFPSQFGNKLPKKSERGTMRWHRDGQLVFIKWKDTKDVCVLSTFHEATGTDQAKRRKKIDGKYQEMLVDIPPAIKSYNQSMGGVDLSDQLLQYYAVLRKANKWWKTLFFHFIDVCVVNSYILFKS